MNYSINNVSWKIISMRISELDEPGKISVFYIKTSREKGIIVQWQVFYVYENVFEFLYEQRISLFHRKKCYNSLFQQSFKMRFSILVFLSYLKDYCFFIAQYNSISPIFLMIAVIYRIRLCIWMHS